MDDYYYDFENRQHYFDFVKETCKSRDLIVKFSAEWCGPCKNIQDYCVNQFHWDAFLYLYFLTFFLHLPIPTFLGRY